MAKKISPASSPPSPSTTSVAATVTNTAAATTSKKSASASADGQRECCIIGCANPASKRSRFSLRLYKDKDFKADFLENNWNKVCERHYFQDLYQFKKLNKTTTVRNTNSKNSSPNSSAVNASSNANSNKAVANNTNANAKEVETEASDKSDTNGSLGSAVVPQPVVATSTAQQTALTPQKKEEKISSPKKRDYDTMVASSDVAETSSSSIASTDSVAPSAKKRKIWTLKEKTSLIHKIATLDEETVKRIIDIITSSSPASCQFFHNDDTLEVDVNKFDESTFEKINTLVGLSVGV